jgi:type IV secretory pathway VirB4 component
VVLGRVRHRSAERSFGIGQEDRRRHLYIVGKTGMGKTTLLEGPE